MKRWKNSLNKKSVI